MGQIDVTDILGDPDMVDPITLIHRTPTVDQYGKNQLAEQLVQTYGSVQPAPYKTIQRLPELLRTESLMSFWVQGKIISDGRCQYPDIIVWQCNRYEVKQVFEFTNWGAGWCEGVCVRQKPTL